MEDGEYYYQKLDQDCQKMLKKRILGPKDTKKTLTLIKTIEYMLYNNGLRKKEMIKYLNSQARRTQY